MKNKHAILVIIALIIPALIPFIVPDQPWAGEGGAGMRRVTNIDRGWQFALIDGGRAGVFEAVDLPHSWNTEDTLDGDFTYRMGEAVYKKDMHMDVEPDRRYFLRFEGANEKAWVKVNGREAGSHKGGYTAFAFEITDLVEDGSNSIEVKVDNSLDRDIMPLYCDFNFYGGIYRSVHLISTARDCIAVTDYASPGVFLTQKNVSSQSADLEMLARISSSSGKGLSVRYIVMDSNGRKVKTVKAEPTPEGEWLEAVASLTMDNPRLWNGLKDPYMYRVRTELVSKGKVIDAVEQPLGLRYYHVDGEEGFFLNGEKLRIHGVCRHQDREGKANAISAEDHEQDFALMREMGVNAVRLAHYPQADYAYSICDREGILVWAEIPFIGKVGDRTGTFLKSESFRNNLRQQLTEMIRQNYNHPSILFWGLFNEIRAPGDPTDLVRDLNALAKLEDPFRLTTAATHNEGGFNDMSDLICWNRYHGWYYNLPRSFGKWADEQHAKHPGRLLCVSEYGGGASVKQHSEIDYYVPTLGPWHPENWQAHIHEQHWDMIMERDYLWGSFLWNMFDFCVVSRREGDRPNINDKGMVTFNRQVKKDAFYFYKANWNPEPMVHIADKKFKRRRSPIIEVKVYSNAGPITLNINDREIPMKSMNNNVHIADNVRLNIGANKVTATAVTDDGRTITDSCEWKYLVK